MPPEVVRQPGAFHGLPEVGHLPAQAVLSCTPSLHRGMYSKLKPFVFTLCD